MLDFRQEASVDNLVTALELGLIVSLHYETLFAMIAAPVMRKKQRLVLSH